MRYMNDRVLCVEWRRWMLIALLLTALTATAGEDTCSGGGVPAEEGCPSSFRNWQSRRQSHFIRRTHSRKW